MCGSFEQRTGPGLQKLLRDKLAERNWAHVCTARFVMNANGAAGSRIGNHSEDLLPLPCFILWGEPAVDTDRHLAASAKCRQRGALCSDLVTRGLVVEECDGRNCSCVVFAGFDAERA